MRSAVPASLYETRPAHSHSIISAHHSARLLYLSCRPALASRRSVGSRGDVARLSRQEITDTFVNLARMRFEREVTGVEEANVSIRIVPLERLGTRRQEERRARRWCGMAICGNRAKQAAHRNRLKKR